ncbi:MAG: alpha/beta fold hydrolase, partial [Nitriliruptoraceae bacterium]
MGEASTLPEGSSLELLSIPTDDDPLDGLWYAAAAPARGGVLLLHGNTMNLLAGPPRYLPPRLVADGWDCLAFNRRGHDVLGTRNSRILEGGAFQTAAQGLDDITSATDRMRRRGHDQPVLIGHSNGGTLGAAWTAARPGRVRALVLLSAHRGGSDTLAWSSAMGHLAGDRLDEALAEAESLVADGRGDELMLLPGWWHVISAASLLDRRDHTPDLLAAARGIDCPVLFLVGDREEDPDVYPAGAFRDACPSRCDVVVVDDCDHFQTGRESHVTDL